ncbi:MAG: glutathione S-transferase family protein [Alphaproteobacteria bacterium]
MKLFYTPLKNYVHKVQVVAIEVGVYDRIERIATDPYTRQIEHLQANPLSKVPTLILDDGSPLYGGPAIYEYLDSLNDEPKMFPPAGPARWAALRQLALGDAMFDTFVLRQNELKRPHEFIYPAALEAYMATVARALDALEEEAPTFSGFTIGLISIACGLMYLTKIRDRDGMDLDWRDDHPDLSAWYDRFTDRPSFTPRDNDIALR